MATAALLCSEYLRCPVCLDVFHEPVTIPCGHTFCMSCITQCWSLQDASISCPQCRSTFSSDSQPRLCKNSILSQMVDHFSNMQRHSEKVTAKIRQAGPHTACGHQKLEEEPTTDNRRVTPSASPGAPDCANPSVSLLRERGAVTQLFSDMVRILQASGFRLLQLMEQSDSGERAQSYGLEEGQIMDAIQSAQELHVSDEVEPVWSGLSAAVSKFKESLLDLCADHMGRMVQKVWRTRTGCLPMSSELSGNPLSPLMPRVRVEFLQYLRNISLDPDTAHHNLYLMQGDRRVLCKLQPQAYPEHPGRFDHYTQVMGREALGQGRHYWEVHLSGNRVSLGVSYRGISRKGHQSHCLAGRNSHSWCLEWSSTRCCAWHDGQKVLVAIGQQERLGIFLDWDAGSLSFHEVSDEMPLLHRFRASFIQPVYPIFFISWNSIVSIGDGQTTQHFNRSKHFHRQLSANF
ncbi:E3 ubiquitin-protein ligase TRIM47 [Spea bombifrons]|uniref:E3 ubiquitin-protein ligase TRIM47 n=1 Tax=Spea bombifrons TaxID=233779 RepID=UPI00234989E6|nr:E3 ubiquitin-protein ligase TRIM47 [Spea bombifrons]